MTKADIQLLADCARVAGIPVCHWSRPLNAWVLKSPVFELWNPLTNDGDSRRLVILREMTIGYRKGISGAAKGEVYAKDRESDDYLSLDVDDDPSDALRRAVVLAVVATLKEPA